MSGSFKHQLWMREELGVSRDEITGGSAVGTWKVLANSACPNKGFIPCSHFPFLFMVAINFLQSPELWAVLIYTDTQHISLLCDQKHTT